jgi:hypothetical protein
VRLGEAAPFRSRLGHDPDLDPELDLELDPELDLDLDLDPDLDRESPWSPSSLFPQEPRPASPVTAPARPRRSRATTALSR